MKFRDQLPKMMILFGILLLYAIIGSVLLVLVNAGILHKSAPTAQVADGGTDQAPLPVHIDPTESLGAAITYLDADLRKPSGHIDLYKPFYEKQNITEYNDTNSEAVSYYLLIMAQQGNKEAFDSELAFIKDHMLHPTGGYMMWKLDDNDIASGDGQNIAPDADLRALHALYVAKDRWGDPAYDKMINQLASGLEKVALNNDGVLLAYGGMSGDTPWKASESYLAYSDFQVYDRLANTRGGIWTKVAKKMREITLQAQIWNGLYNTVYFTDNRTGGPYGNHIDGGKYSINSMWIMVRFAESNDQQLMDSARKSLQFYKEAYAKDGKIVNAYTSSGDPASEDESPWAYALIARAAASLHDDSFAQIMERRMRNFQDLDNSSSHYGAFVEGALGDERAGQFTIQESILSLQELQRMAPRVNE